jgi:hypothetical protein
MTGRIAFLFLAIVVLAGPQPVNSQRAENFDGFQLVDKEGNIRKPADYRDRYEMLGTYTVIDRKGNQMHVTYATPGTESYFGLSTTDSA